MNLVTQSSWHAPFHYSGTWEWYGYALETLILVSLPLPVARGHCFLNQSSANFVIQPVCNCAWIIPGRSLWSRLGRRTRICEGRPWGYLTCRLWSRWRTHTVVIYLLPWPRTSNPLGSETKKDPVNMRLHKCFLTVATDVLRRVYLATND